MYAVRLGGSAGGRNDGQECGIRQAGKAVHTPAVRQWRGALLDVKTYDRHPHHTSADRRSFRLVFPRDS